MVAVLEGGLHVFNSPCPVWKWLNDWKNGNLFWGRNISHASFLHHFSLMAGLLWRALAPMTVEVNGAQVSQEQWGARWATLYVESGYPFLHLIRTARSFLVGGSQVVLRFCICSTSRAEYLLV